MATPCPACGRNLASRYECQDQGLLGRKVTLIDDSGSWQKWTDKIKCPKCLTIYESNNEILKQSCSQDIIKMNCDLAHIKESIINADKNMPDYLKIYPGEKIWADDFFFYWEKSLKISNVFIEELLTP